MNCGKEITDDFFFAVQGNITCFLCSFYTIKLPTRYSSLVYIDHHHWIIPCLTVSLPGKAIYFNIQKQVISMFVSGISQCAYHVLKNFCVVTSSIISLGWCHSLRVWIAVFGGYSTTFCLTLDCKMWLYVTIVYFMHHLQKHSLFFALMPSRIVDYVTVPVGFPPAFGVLY